MTTITADPDLEYARMRITVLDATGGDLTRTDSYGTHDVRGGQNVTGDTLIDDYDCPFGEPVSYALEDGTDTAQLDVTSCWLSHPTDPTLGMQVDIGDDENIAWESPAGEAINILGSEWPVAVYTRRNVHTGTLVIYRPWEDRHAVKALFLPGSPLLLRVPAGAYLDTQWIWPTSVVREKVGPVDSPNRLRFDVSYQRVADPVGYVTQDPSNSITAVNVSHNNYAEIGQTYPDYLTLLATPHPHDKPPT